jgi:hypothetical protein
MVAARQRAIWKKTDLADYMAMHAALPQDRHRDLKTRSRPIKQW